MKAGNVRNHHNNLPIENKMLFSREPSLPSNANCHEIKIVDSNNGNFGLWRNDVYHSCEKSFRISLMKNHVSYEKHVSHYQVEKKLHFYVIRISRWELVGIWILLPSNSINSIYAITYLIIYLSSIKPKIFIISGKADSPINKISRVTNVCFNSTAGPIYFFVIVECILITCTHSDTNCTRAKSI